MDDQFKRRPIEEMTADLYQSIGDELCRDPDLAVDLYRALCNNIWVKDDRSYEVSWRGAGETVAWIRNASGCPREDYLDYYLAGEEGSCSPRIVEMLSGIGYRSL